MIAEYIASAVTAFIISGGGALGVVAISGGSAALNKTALIAAGIVGAISAAKDLRSLMKLPPVSADALQSPPTGPKSQP